MKKFNIMIAQPGGQGSLKVGEFDSSQLEFSSDNVLKGPEESPSEQERVYFRLREQINAENLLYT
ncbi:MAG: hypothetical protein AAGC96_06965, partial [Pseudomonadota bacterium]